MRSFIASFTVMRGSPRELWIIYLTKILEIVAYGLMNTTLVLWLSSDLGFSDAEAGDTVAIWSTLMTLATVLVGSLVDSIGIKKSFLFGFWLCLLSRAMMTGTANVWMALVLGMLPMAVGHAMMVPVMNAALKIYSTVRQRTMAFALFYTMMNVGFAIAGWVFDFVRAELGEYGTQTLLGMELSTYRVLFFWATVATLPGLLITWFFMRDGVEATEEGIQIRAQQPRYRDSGLLMGTALSIRDAAQGTISKFVSVWRQSNFYRFLAFLTLVTMIRVVFFHMHYTFPKYGIRELGEGAPVGQLWGVLNPVIIVLLTPIVGALTGGMRAYSMIAVGSSAAALPVFFLAMPREWFQGLADGWPGHLIAHQWLGVEGPVNPLYVSIAIFVVLFSIGEAIWSPRLYEYTAAIAPKGQEGSYMALSVLPYFVAKLFVGMLSGRLLEAYCPAEGPRNSEMLWLVIALMALICPIGILVFRKHIRAEEAGRDDEAVQG
ncbi:MAG: MFS transporter [Proteobacteria bacterium]|nr:MFS transporter [Pseudomonadota bacterium]